MVAERSKQADTRPDLAGWRERIRIAGMFVVCFLPLFLTLLPASLLVDNRPVVLFMGAFSTVLLLIVTWRLHGQRVLAERLKGELERLVRTDPLTGVGNRRAFGQAIVMEARRAVRQRYPVVILFLDIDEFKAINDGWGHPAGDRVLRSFAELLTACTREDQDQVYRIGGDEFVVILPGVDVEDAETIVRRIVDAFPDAVGDSVPRDRCRFSAGIARHLPDETPETWFGRADTAMYDAKEDSTTCYAVAPEVHPLALSPSSAEE